jgi:hypothetical protein
MSMLMRIVAILALAAGGIAASGSPASADHWAGIYGYFPTSSECWATSSNFARYYKIIQTCTYSSRGDGWYFIYTHK